MYITGQILCKVSLKSGFPGWVSGRPLMGNVDVCVGREELCFLVGPLCGHLQIKTAFQNKNGL